MLYGALLLNAILYHSIAILLSGLTLALVLALAQKQHQAANLLLRRMNFT